MVRVLPVILLLLPLCFCGNMLDDVLDPIHDVDKAYHYVEGGVKATQNELELAAILGPNGVAILLIVAMVELFLLLSFTCCWCCKCCCCSYLKRKPAAPPQVTVVPQQQIGMVPTGAVYPSSAPAYTPNTPNTHSYTPATYNSAEQYAGDAPPDYSNYKMDVPLLDNME